MRIVLLVITMYDAVTLGHLHVPHQIICPDSGNSSVVAVDRSASGDFIPGRLRFWQVGLRYSLACLAIVAFGIPCSSTHRSTLRVFVMSLHTATRAARMRVIAHL